MTTRIPSPVAQWTEPVAAGVAIPLQRLYWHYDVPTDTWTISASPALESGRLTDDGTGDVSLVLLASIPVGATTLRAALVNGADVLFY